MGSLWNSLSIVELIGSTAQWFSAISVIVALVFSMRGTTLTKRDDAEKAMIELGERSRLKDELVLTKEKLEESEKSIAKLIAIDASAAPAHVKLPAYGKFTYAKIDPSANHVIISPGVEGQTIGGGIDDYTISGKGETVTLELSGTNWIIL